MNFLEKVSSLFTSQDNKDAEISFKIGYFLFVYTFSLYFIRMAIIEGNFHYLDLFNHISIFGFAVEILPFILPAILCYIYNIPKLLCFVIVLFMCNKILFLDLSLYTYDCIWSLLVDLYLVLAIFLIYRSRKLISFKETSISKKIKRFVILLIAVGYSFGFVIVVTPVWDSVLGGIDDYFEYKEFIAREESQIQKDEDYKEYVRVICHPYDINGDYYFDDVKYTDFKTKEEADIFYKGVRKAYDSKQKLYDQIRRDVSQRALKCYQNTYKISNLEGFVRYAPINYGENFWERVRKSYDDYQKSNPWGVSEEMTEFNKFDTARSMIEENCLDFAIQEYIQEKSIQELFNKKGLEGNGNEE